MRRKQQRSKILTPERAEAKRLRRITATAAIAGLPDIQRRAGDLEIAQVPQIGVEPTPIKETVRKLTPIEKLARSGVLEPHEAAACEWYASAHALGFDTIGCTANYEGAGGGSFGAGDLTARYKAQMLAREDYFMARKFIPAGYLAIFEAIVCRSDTVSQIAAASFELERSQAQNRVRLALKLCANRLHMGIAPLLEIDAPPAKPSAEPARPAAAQREPVAHPARPVSDALACALVQAAADGVTIAQIQLAEPSLIALHRELGHAAPTYAGIPLAIRAGWPWGYLLIPEGAADTAGQPPAAASSDPAAASVCPPPTRARC